ncbi:MAG: DUF4249 family protein [Cytophagales bacterium]|nr:DUF4249 family protein [Cytophagales bacterium]
MLACTDPYSIDLEQSDPQLVVEALLKHDANLPQTVGRDTVLLTQTQKFIGNDKTLATIDNASVSITSNAGQTENLTPLGNGRYASVSLIKKIGYQYTLTVKTPDGETYNASTWHTRPCVYDSLTQKILDKRNPNTPAGVIPKGVYIDIAGYDPAGAGDSYWLRLYFKRVYKNIFTGKKTSPYFKGDSNLTKYDPWHYVRDPNKIGISLDGISADNNTDTLQNSTNRPFALVLKDLILNDLDGPAISDKPAYFPGDSVWLDIVSLTYPHLIFLQRMKKELENGTGGGLAGLFSTPPSNLPTNIINANSNGKKAVGWFGAGTYKTHKIRIINFDFIENQGTPGN